MSIYKNKMWYIIPIILFPVGFGLVIYTILHPEMFRKIGVITIPRELPVDGFNVPVLATYEGVSGVKLLAFKINSYSPSLVLFQDRIEIKIFKTHAFNVADVQKVDIFQTYKTNNIVFHLDNQNTYSANLLREENLITLVRFFQNNNIPLSDQAIVLLNKQNNEYNSMTSNIIELRSGEVIPEAKQVLYTYLNGDGRSSFIIPLDTKNLYKYAIVSYKWNVRPDAKVEKQMSWIYENGNFIPENIEVLYEYPELKGKIKTNNGNQEIYSIAKDRVVIQEDNFEELKKLPGFEGFTYNENISID